MLFTTALLILRGLHHETVDDQIGGFFSSHDLGRRLRIQARPANQAEAREPGYRQVADLMIREPQAHPSAIWAV